MKFKFQCPRRKSHPRAPMLSVDTCCRDAEGVAAVATWCGSHGSRCACCTTRHAMQHQLAAFQAPHSLLTVTFYYKKRKVDSVSQIGVRGCVDGCVTQPLHHACFAVTLKLSPKDASSTHRPDWGSSELTDGMVRKRRKFKAECLNKAEQLTNCELSRSRLIAAAVETGPSK